mmetsp:Transcript_2422/g.3557  ORF Transcript_2422/g.3557 Transcript_2422/m.3557 type:complete len:119 (-) Transcript_2422:516-872(-)
MSLLEKITTKAENFIDDITTLEVTTLTGNLSTKVIVDPNNGNKIDFQKILDTLAPADGTESEINVVAATKIDFDNDVVQYVQKGAKPDLVRLHDNAIKNSQEARSAFLNAMLSFKPGS